MEIEKQIEILDTICPLEKPWGNSKRCVRVKFFDDIQTEIQAYLLGFYVADGSLNIKRNTVRVSVTNEDKEIIDLYAKYISPNAYRQQLNPSCAIGPSGKIINIKTVAKIDIASKQIRNALLSFGYGENKTYLPLKLPNLHEDLMWHFIRGYFDGDGCITGSFYKSHSKKQGKPPYLVYNVSWTAKTNTLLNELCQFLRKHEIICNVYYLQTRDCYRLCVSNKPSIKLLFKYLYETFSFCLNRKYEKFNHFVNTEESQLITEFRNAQELKASDTNNTPTSAEHPTGMNICADLTGNCENSEIKSSEDNNMRMERNDGSKCCQAIHDE